MTGPELRATAVLRAVLPAGAVIEPGQDGSVLVAGQRVTPWWLGRGHLGEARRFLAEAHDPQQVIAVAPEFSAGARAALSEAAFGWADETGAAEIALGTVVVSRSGRPASPADRPLRWTASVEAISEAILCGVPATVAATQEATQLSTGSCTNGLRFLTDQGLLESSFDRGPGSARSIVARERFLDAYADAARARSHRSVALTVGVAWQDPVACLSEVGRAWDAVGVGWAATGVVAASALAPLITNVTSVEVYLNSSTIAELEAAASTVGLAAIDGGRLTLRTPPTVTIHRLAEQADGLRVAPWPRVFVDLRSSGVRGEDAAEHLREANYGR